MKKMRFSDRAVSMFAIELIDAYNGLQEEGYHFGEKVFEDLDAYLRHRGYAINADQHGIKGVRLSIQKLVK